MSRRIANAPLDLTDGQTRAEVIDATRFLEKSLVAALKESEPGDGGSTDQALGLIALLAGQLDEDAEAYVMELFRAAAYVIAESYPDLLP